MVKEYSYHKLWGSYLFQYLKEAGESGLTVEEIRALFPQKSRGAIISFLYHHQVPRRACQDEETGKCKKIYFYPKKEIKNWKKWVKKELKETEFGLSLTDILLETGVQKKKVLEYLKALSNSPGYSLREINLLKHNHSKRRIDVNNIITRYYVGDRKIKIKKDEVTLKEYQKRVKQGQDTRVMIKSELDSIITAFLKDKGRFTIKDVQDKLVHNKHLASNYVIRYNISKKFKVVRCINILDQKKRAYNVYFEGGNPPLKIGEIEEDKVPILIEKFIIQGVEAMKAPSKEAIKDYVGHCLGDTTSKGAFIDGWSDYHVPNTMFQNIFHTLVKERKIEKHKDNYDWFYTEVGFNFKEYYNKLRGGKIEY